MSIGAKQSLAPVCEHCQSPASEAAATCFTCGAHLGAPNVRSANSTREREALAARYDKVLADAAVDGTQGRLADFAEKMKVTSAVFNVDINFLHTFVTNEKALYTSYSLGTRGQVRKPAEGENDRRRLTVEGMLFGSYGEDIRYAALSLDGAGLKSYGSYSVRLREVSIDKRATLLEDNSYVFAEKHQMAAGTQIPVGYRSSWEEREKLALVKLAQRVISAGSDKEYPAILLFSEGDYKTDDFIEVHIYGPFDARAIDSVMGSSKSGDKVDLAMVESVKEHLSKAGKQWIEA